MLEPFLGDDGQAHVEDRDAARGLPPEGAVVRVPVEGYRGTSVVEGGPQAARAEEGVDLRRLTLDRGADGRVVQDGHATLFDPDPVVEAYGNFPADLPGRLLGAAISPLLNYAGTYVNLWENVKRDRSAESFLGVSKWVDDGVPFPGEAFRRWIKDFYQQNKLAKGELQLRGRRVDLSNIGCRVLNIAG